MSPAGPPAETIESDAAAAPEAPPVMTTDGATEAAAPDAAVAAPAADMPETDPQASDARASDAPASDAPRSDEQASDAPVATPSSAEDETPAEFFDAVTGDYIGPERRRHPLRRRMITTFMMVGFALLAFATGLIVFNSVLMPRLIHGVGQVAVPDLTGRTLTQAEQQLAALGLQLSRAGERFDPSVPRGMVLSQDPPAGEHVRGSRRVSVVVSLGEEFSSVPAVFGESQRSAEALLRSAGLKVGFITRAPSEVVGEGLVAGSDPGAETVLSRDTPVNLLVSMGAGEESFVMPDVSGREIGGVRRQLEALGYKVVTPTGAVQMGTIIAQDPPPGSRITRATTIILQATGRVIP